MNDMNDTVISKEEKSRIDTEFYSLTECANMFSTTPTTILRLRNQSKFPDGKRFGKRWLFPKNSVDEVFKSLFDKSQKEQIAKTETNE